MRGLKQRGGGLLQGGEGEEEQAKGGGHHQEGEGSQQGACFCIFTSASKCSAWYPGQGSAPSDGHQSCPVRTHIHLH